MPLMICSVRQAFAQHLAEHQSIDKALAHAITVAYERGLDDGRRSQAPVMYDDAALRLLAEIVSPDGFGYAVSDEVRRAAGRVLSGAGRPLADGPA
jgi:hypothetical protein